MPTSAPRRCGNLRSGAKRGLSMLDSMGFTFAPHPKEAISGAFSRPLSSLR